MECTNLVDPHQLLCHWFTVVFVLFYIYTPYDLFPRAIVNKSGGRPLIFCYAARDWSILFRKFASPLSVYFGFSLTPTCLQKNKSGLPKAFIWRTISNLEKKKKTRMKCLFRRSRIRPFFGLPLQLWTLLPDNIKMKIFSNILIGE